MHTVGRLGKRFGLSRSALLYYDEIGLLSPSARSGANYRLYSDADVARLERIMIYRDAGLPLEAIAELLPTDGVSAAAVLERHLLAVNDEIARLRQQQRVISRLLGDTRLAGRSGAMGKAMGKAMSKAQWVALLASTGLDDEGTDRWHREFEKMSPEAHQDFLESLGIAPQEIAQIRAFSRRETVEGER
jgi:DNA-binding transcriptional MerR regulator